MNTNMTNRCRVLRPLVLAALLTFAAIANIASPAMAAPTDPPTPQCVAECKNQLGIVGILPIVANVLCLNFCDNDTVIECKNDCESTSVVSLLDCNQLCIDIL